MDAIIYFSSCFIKVRKGRDVEHEELERILGFPNVAYVVDGMHVLLNGLDKWTGIYNRKAVPTLYPQGVVDSKERFQ